MHGPNAAASIAPTLIRHCSPSLSVCRCICLRQSSNLGRLARSERDRIASESRRCQSTPARDTFTLQQRRQSAAKRTRVTRGAMLVFVPLIRPRLDDHWVTSTRHRHPNDLITALMRSCFRFCRYTGWSVIVVVTAANAHLICRLPDA